MGQNTILIIHHLKDHQWAQRLETQMSGFLYRDPFKVEIRTGEVFNDTFEQELVRRIDEAGNIVLLLSDALFEEGLLQHASVRKALKRRHDRGRSLTVVLVSSSPWKRFKWLKNNPHWPSSGFLAEMGDIGAENLLFQAAEQAISIFGPRGLITRLCLTGLGPSDRLTFNAAPRLNIITGDNALGKSFLLECAWWLFSGVWARYPAMPRSSNPLVEAGISANWTRSGVSSESLPELAVSYDRRRDIWPERLTVFQDLMVYARADNSFCVWDPIQAEKVLPPGSKPRSPLIVSQDEAWNGVYETVRGSDIAICEGVLRGWVEWQENDSPVFSAFCKILEALTENLADSSRIVPGEPVPLPNFEQKMPTLVYPYGVVPLVHAAASVQRIVSLAYMLVWTWQRYRMEKTPHEPIRHMVFLIDEIEANLHPRWMRTIIPALLKVGALLASHIQVQFIITTHAPLVLAGAEPVFDQEKDSLFHFYLDPDSRQAQLSEIPFLKHGRADNWLTSDAFGLTHARSREASAAIERAKAIQLEQSPDPVRVQAIHKELQLLLGARDTFWPRWSYFAKTHGGQP